MQYVGIPSADGNYIDLTLDATQLKKFITSSVARLLKEKCIKINHTFNETTQILQFDITFNKPDWFKELESDIQSSIYTELQRVVEKMIHDINDEHNKTQAAEQMKQGEDAGASEGNN